MPQARAYRLSHSEGSLSSPIYRSMLDASNRPSSQDGILSHYNAYTYPELFREDNSSMEWTAAADIFALGTLLHRMASDHAAPVKENAYEDLLEVYLKWTVDTVTCGRRYKTLLINTMEWSPSRRWTAQRVLRYAKQIQDERCWNEGKCPVRMHCACFLLRLCQKRLTSSNTLKESIHSTNS